MSARRTVLLLTLAAAAPLAGCAGEDTHPGSGAGKADDLGACDDGVCACGDDAAFIEKAQADLIRLEPDSFADLALEFIDEDAAVDYVGDLDANGMTDLIVNSGLQFGGGNFMQVVYLTGTTGCPSEPAVWLSASEVWPDDDGRTTAGVRDLTGLNFSGCDASITRYAYDGKGRYVEAENRVEDLCEDDGGDQPEGDLGDATR